MPVSNATLQIPTARAFEPLLYPARYKGAWGGRGSGKSHFFAEAMIEDSLREPGDNGGEGLRSVCIRENQRSLKESAKRLLEDKVQAMGLGDNFTSFHDRIETPGDGIIIFQGMQDHTAESIKSLEGYKRAWCEEAQTLSERSLRLLRPTIRIEGSELWFSWNPRRKADPVDLLLRGNSPPESIVVNANWRDNPWFPDVLEKERLYDKENSPETYEHVWEGDYAGVSKGAYYAQALTQAKQDGRITRLVSDPLMSFICFWDIGGTGRSYSDACSIWVTQFVGQMINVLDHYTTVGQPLALHLNWLRDNGYGGAKCVLPHDGKKTDGITIKRYEDHIRDAGFEVDVVKNQGAGAAMKRVEAARRMFPRVWFNNAPLRDIADATEAGRASLGWYHEKIDEKRQIGMGPDHDWSSHDADAFGLIAAYGDRGMADIAYHDDGIFPTDMPL